MPDDTQHPYLDVTSGGASNRPPLDLRMQQKVLDGRYELDRKIGEGGMARVYLGRDQRLNRRVAVKIPHKHYAGDADFIERFRHEAQAAAILTHPNIVDVYDVGQDGDIYYIVMEYVEGTDLKSVINHEAPLPVNRAVAIAEQIARGLHAAHRAGLIHRDIKPQNVIVTPDGQARITDFGVAKSHLSTALTETGVSFGTVDYISPEQAQGRQATAQSDVYSLGVVLYEMLTGRLPFGGDSAVAVAMKHVTEDPPPPRHYNPQIPPQLEALVLRTLAKDPAQRPQSALEFAQQLVNYSQIALQETLVNPALGGRLVVTPEKSRSGPPIQPRATGGNGGGPTGRVKVPPARQTTARAPRQDGLGCGIFLVGMLILAGVLGIVLLFSTGAFNNLFAGFGGLNQRPTQTEQPQGGIFGIGGATPTPVPQVPVPELSGHTDAEAQEMLRQLQLVPLAQQANDGTVPLNQVISQAVPAGTLLSQGQTVTYTVSLGPVLVAVPNVVGVRENIARSQIEAAGLVVDLVREPNLTIDAGFVIATSPSANLKVSSGDTVQVRVSLGDVVRFPDVIGKQRAEAEQLLNNTPGIEIIYVDEQGPDRLSNFESYAPGQVVSAQVQGSSTGLTNGDYVPRGSKLILGVRAP